jgi:hypothetical protein
MRVVRSSQIAPAICDVNQTNGIEAGGLIHAAVGNRQQRSDHQRHATSLLSLQRADRSEVIRLCLRTSEPAD